MQPAHGIVFFLLQIKSENLTKKKNCDTNYYEKVK